MAWCPNGWLNTTQQFLHSINATIALQKPWVPLPRQANDRNIMEDIHHRLPNADQLATYNVSLFLHVFFLLEITDANGITILPNVIENGPRRSGSTLQWLRQPTPLPEAWKHWKQAIQELYLKTNSNCLINPLKEWTDTTNVECKWEWRIDFYQWNGCRWTSR